MHPPYYRGCWHGVSRCLFFRYDVNLFFSEKRSKQSANFYLHTALLRQAFAHCGKFLTAASRRSLGRVSVPVWLIILSDQLLIVALVGLYPTNKLIRRKPILRRFSPFHSSAYGVLAAVSSCYPPPKGRFLRVTHPSATTTPPLTSKGGVAVRLACVKHAASVHPEPGSNSP